MTNSTHLQQDFEQTLKPDIFLTKGYNDFFYLAENAGLIVWLCDAAGKIIFSSSGWGQLTGINNLQENSAEWLKAVPEAYRQSTQYKWEQNITAGIPFTQELAVVTQNGMLQKIQIKAEPRYTPAGTPSHWIILISAIKDNVLLNGNAEISPQQFLAKITDYLPGIVTVFHAETGKYIFVNHAVEELLGFSKEDFFKGGFGFAATLLHPDDAETVLKKNTEAIEAANEQPGNDAQAVEFEYRLRKKDGTYCWLHTYGVIFNRNKKGHIEHILNISIDVTERKSIENDLRKSEAFLKDSQLIGQVGSFIWNFEDPETGFYTDACVKIFEPVLQIPLKLKKFLNHVHPNDKDKLEYVIKDAFQNDTTAELEYRLVDKQGETVKYLWFKGKAEKGDNGKPVQLVGTVQDITEKKQTEENLRQKSDLLNKILNSRPFVILRLSANGDIIEADGSGLTRLGVEMQMLLGKNLLEIYPDYADNYRKALQGKDVDFIVPVRRNDEITYWQNNNFYDKENGGVINFSYEVTELIKTQQALKAAESELQMLNKELEERITLRTRQLRESESNLKEAQGISHMGSWSYDPETNKIAWSEELFHIHELDIKNGEPTYEEMLSFYPEANLLTEKVNTALTTGTPYQVDLSLITRSGKKKYIHAIGRPLMEGGKCLKLYGTTLDITARKNIELELNTTMQQLQLIINAVPALIAYIKPDQTYGFANKAYQNWFGINSEKIIGKKVAKVIEPGIYNKISPFINCALKGETKCFDIELLNQEGIIRNAEVMYIPDFDNSGTVRGIVVLVLDVTDKKRFEEELEHRINERTSELQLANQELKRSNQELEQFAYVASHDLKEPLRMVSTYTQLLKKKYGETLNEEASEFMQYSVEGASRMGLLIQDLLDYSRIGRHSAVQTNINLNSVLNDVLKNLEQKAKDHKATIIVETELPVLFSSYTNLLQLFQNLVSNGIKFHGEEPPVVKINAQEQENQWIFSIADNGIGIEPEYLEKIFVIFQRLHSRDKYPGTGIGLAICKKIVEYHGGNIWVESTPGKGTTFYFSLPK